MLLLQQQKSAITTMSAKIFAASMVVIATMVIMMSPAFALASFNMEDGTGFVGKGDVQSAFGWNNAKAQTEAGNLTFTYIDQATYNLTCDLYFSPGNSGESTYYETVTVSREQSVNDAVAYASRTEQQVNGFNLVGYSSQTGSNFDAPQIGDSCPRSIGRGIVTAVELVSSTPGGLYVSDPSLLLGPVQIWAPAN